MQITDDPQNALDLWNADDTQWIMTDGAEYAVCTDGEGCVLIMSGWEITSPEELARTIEA